MSKLYDLRAELAASIIAANIGFTAENIILKRQTDLWNDVATVLAVDALGLVLHIGIAEGAASEPDSLELDLTIPLTILCLPQIAEGTTPEEDVWQALVQHVHDLRLSATEPYAWRFRFKSFSDIEIQADHGTGYLGRQSVFTKHLSL
jgi:hypothetical protein